MTTGTVDHVMTTDVVSVSRTATYRELVDLMVGRRISAVPVVDDFRHVSGLVSEADLLRKIEYAGEEEPRMFEGHRRRGERAKASARTAADLMSSPPVVILAGSTIAAAARLMDAEHVKRLPVVDDLGRLVGIVTRSDLLKVYLRRDEDILADIRVAVLQSYLPEAVRRIHAEVADGTVTLAGRVERWSTTDLAVRLIRQVPGVVTVRDLLTYEVDDQQAVTPSPFAGLL